MPKTGSKCAGRKGLLKRKERDHEADAVVFIP
jgi:hypothetical protein